MTLKERKQQLINEISNIDSSAIILRLEQEISLLKQNIGNDILDGLSKVELDELAKLISEPISTDVVNNDEYRNLTSKWRTL